MCLKQSLGKKGEEIATKYLEENNYKIIDKNFSCRQGEIDIIAHDLNSNELVFVEVKCRSNLNYGTPANAVDFNKQKHIIRVAEFYVFKNKIYNVGIRFDVIEIYGNQFRIQHIIKAFTK